MTIEIVRFENGKYGVRRKQPSGCYYFLGKRFFFLDFEIEKYEFRSEEAARKALKKWEERERERNDEGTPIGF